MNQKANIKFIIEISSEVKTKEFYLGGKQRDFKQKYEIFHRWMDG